MKRYRPQTPREILARDHNWHMGRLRRIYHGMGVIRDPIRKDQIQNLIQEEMKSCQEQYEKERDEL